jgi:hypothetical protein
MEKARIELSAREGERWKVLHEVEQGHLRQVEAAQQLRISDRQVRRLLQRLRTVGDRGLVHRLRGCRSNRKTAKAVTQVVLRELRKPLYDGFGPTLAAEHLARNGIGVSRETLRKWTSQAGLWRSRQQRVKSVHVWRPRRSAFGELVMMDSSPYRWPEERGPACHLVALIDDASSWAWGRFVEHDSTEENLRTPGGWLERHGRPLALYTDKNSLFVTSRHPEREEQLRDTPACTQFGRALAEMGIEWIAAHSPQAKGRIERMFGTLQDRLVKQMRWAEINTLEAANRFLEITYWPSWQERFAVQPAQSRDAHRRLERAHRLEQILSVRVARTVASDHTVSWKAQRWGVRREDVCAGLRGAAGGARRNPAAARWQSLASFPRPLPATPALPSRAAIRKSFRPTASRPCGSQTKTPNPNQNPLQSTSPSPLEEVLGADISTFR